MPDIFIWMLSGGKRVAYTRVQAHNVIYSQVDWEKGRNAGKVQSVFLRVSNYIYVAKRNADLIH